jgi:hypothetical protein
MDNAPEQNDLNKNIQNQTKIQEQLLNHSGEILERAVEIKKVSGDSVDKIEETKKSILNEVSESTKIQKDIKDNAEETSKKIEENIKNAEKEEKKNAEEEKKELKTEAEKELTEAEKRHKELLNSLTNIVLSNESAEEAAKKIQEHIAETQKELLSKAKEDRKEGMEYYKKSSIFFQEGRDAMKEKLKKKVTAGGLGLLGKGLSGIGMKSMGKYFTAQSETLKDELADEKKEQEKGLKKFHDPEKMAAEFNETLKQFTENIAFNTTKDENGKDKSIFGGDEGSEIDSKKQNAVFDAVINSEHIEEKFSKELEKFSKNIEDVGPNSKIDSKKQNSEQNEEKLPKTIEDVGPNSEIDSKKQNSEQNEEKLPKEFEKFSKEFEKFSKNIEGVGNAGSDGASKEELKERQDEKEEEKIQNEKEEENRKQQLAKLDSISKKTSEGIKVSSKMAKGITQLGKTVGTALLPVILPVLAVVGTAIASIAIGTAVFKNFIEGPLGAWLEGERKEQERKANAGTDATGLDIKDAAKKLGVDDKEVKRKRAAGEKLTPNEKKYMKIKEDRIVREGAMTAAGITFGTPEYDAMLKMNDADFKKALKTNAKSDGLFGEKGKAEKGNDAVKQFEAQQRAMEKKRKADDERAQQNGNKETLKTQEKQKTMGPDSSKNYGEVKQKVSEPEPEPTIKKDKVTQATAERQKDENEKKKIQLQQEQNSYLKKIAEKSAVKVSYHVPNNKEAPLTVAGG